MNAALEPALAPYVLSHTEQGVCRLTLNRGERYNPLSRAMIAALQAECTRIAAEPSIRCVVLAADALKLHLVDRLGYVHEAIEEAERCAAVAGAEVALYHRAGYPARSLYAIVPTPAPLSDGLPFSYPGLDRSKLPAFLYLWQPDPTLPRLGSR